MIEIDINEWLDENRRFSDLSKQISQCVMLLENSSCFEKILYYWIRQQIIATYKSIHSDFESKNDQEIIIAWSMEQLKHKLNEIFLEKKDLLDVVSFSMLRIENHSISFEMYHRLVANEANFAELSKSYSVKADRNKDCLHQNQRMGALPIPLQNKLRTMKQGEISKPLELKDSFAILRLESFQRAEFTESMKEKLVLDQFSAWASKVAHACRDRLL